MRYPLAICLLSFICLISFQAQTAVYREVDDQGNITYTDQPEPNAQAVNMKSGEVEPVINNTTNNTTTGGGSTASTTTTTNTVTSPTGSNESAATVPATDSSTALPKAITKTNSTITTPLKKKPPIYSISLISPDEDQTFQNGEDVVVQVTVMPQLEMGDNIVVYVDGAPATEPSNDTSITVPRLDRGSHTIQARIIQPNGTGAETQIVKIFQQRTSVLLPANRVLP